MKLVNVTELPKGKRTMKHDLLEMIDGFVESGSELVKIEFTERDYKNANSCYANMHRAAKNSNHPVAVRMIKNEVYLIKNSYLKRIEA